MSSSAGNSTGQLLCIPPFLDVDNYPLSSGGDVSGRFCMKVFFRQEEKICCLTCPTTEWFFTDAFRQQITIANYVAIPSLVCNVFLLLTFAFVPQEQSHKHFLSIGLSASLALTAIAFIIPLGAGPCQCHNAVTSNNERTDISCAITGSLIEVGAMGAVVWILLRSVWMALMITGNLRRTELFRNISIGLGVGLPLIFLAISVPITGVSYRIGNVCVPNNPSALVTWFGWLLAFGTISWVMQLITIGYCFVKYARSALLRNNLSGSIGSDGESSQRSRRFWRQYDSNEWRRTRELLSHQWRSLVLAFTVASLTIYFTIIFVRKTTATSPFYGDDVPGGSKNISQDDVDWANCMIEHDGDKTKCYDFATGLGLNEPAALGTLILASASGVIVFFLMVRWSMFVGWWDLIRKPFARKRRGSRKSDWIMMNAQDDAVRVETTITSTSARRRPFTP